MKQFHSYLNAVEQHIESGFNLGDAMAKFMPVFNASKPQVQREFKDNLARLISVKKKVPTITLEKGFWKGTLGFTAKQTKGGTDATECARVMLNYYLPAKKVVEKSSTKPVKATKQVKTPVERIKQRVTKFVKEHKKADIQERIDELAIELKLLKSLV
jgi:hypothetical protein